MKHISSNDIIDGGQTKGLTRRALAKQRTRVKVLAAARRLFSEQGYEGATIRDIAAAAGMSTGAVFANFTDKSDLFRDIFITDVQSLVEEQREAAANASDIDGKLLCVFMAGYHFYRSELPLARAAFGVSWSAEEGQVLRNAPPVVMQQALITELVQQAVEAGELSPEGEVTLRSEMLFDAYLSNYVQAIFKGWSLEALKSRARDQIAILLSGARRS